MIKIEVTQFEIASSLTNREKERKKKKEGELSKKEERKR